MCYEIMSSLEKKMGKNPKQRKRKENVDRCRKEGVSRRISEEEWGTDPIIYLI